MASGYTENYGLCQWQGEDKFLREEFNQDNAKIDAALKAAEDKAAAAAQSAQQTADRALSGLEDQSYNVYNLILQNYYDGKYSGYKKALLYDGFLDESGIGAKSDSLLLKDGRLSLYSTGQGNLSMGSYGTSKRSDLESQAMTATGAGAVTGFQCKVYNDMAVATTDSLRATLSVNGEVKLEELVKTTELEVDESKTETFTFSQSVPFCAGDVLMLHVKAGKIMIYTGTDGTHLAGTLLCTPLSGSSGWMTTGALDLPAFSGARAWVRHKSGTLSLSLTGPDGTLSFVPAESRETVEPLDKIACTEQAFTLDEGGGAGSWTLRLDMAGIENSDVFIYDYGIVLQ